MILLYIIVLLFVSIFEIRSLVREKRSRELAVFIVMAVITLGIGLYYLSNPYGKSLAQHIFRILGSSD